MSSIISGWAITRFAVGGIFALLCASWAADARASVIDATTVASSCYAGSGFDSNCADTGYIS
ncbi:hypothetical protein, partial [Acidiphilium sp.]|uniref:hypothetical protein n=1 Tax=Acidiphilium sp. TaxID=527 RepID=UPI003CFEE64D